MSSPAYAQSAPDTTVHQRPDRRMDYEQIFSTNHWNLFIQPGIILAPPHEAYFSHPPLWFKIEPSPDILFGWAWEINFKESWRIGSHGFELRDKPRHKLPLERWGIQTGLSCQLYWFNFNYAVPSSYSGLPGSYFGAPQKMQTGQMYRLPLYAVFRQPFFDRNNSWLATFKLGVDLNMQGSSYVEYGDGSFVNGSSALYTAFQATQLTHPNQALFFYPSFHASAGFDYILPNKKILNLQFIANYSPFYREVTDYTFASTNQPSVSGSGSRLLNYAGVELNYIFTRVRRMQMPGPGFTFLTRQEKKLKAGHFYPYDGDTIPLRKRHYTLPTIFSTDHTNFVFRINLLPFHVPYHNSVAKLYDRADIGFMGGWVYQINFKHRWGLQTGIEGEFNEETYHMFLPRSYSGLNTNLNLPFSSVAVTGVNIPLYACYYVPLHDKNDRWLTNFKLGIDLKYGTDLNATGQGLEGTFSYSYTDPVTLKETQVGSMTTIIKKWTRFYNAFYASAGINYVLPNKKMLNLQIVGSYSPFYQKTYQYAIMPGSPQEIDGSFTRSYSYIGFELNYILTNPTHMKKMPQNYK